VEPLGLEATTFDVDGSRMPDTLASGWAGDVFQGDPTVPYESISSAAWSAGSLVSTTADLAMFLTALFEGELVSDELLAEMLDTGPEGYGLGIASTDLMLGSVGSDAFYGHNGGIPGYISFMAGDPETGDIVVLLSNNEARDPHAAAAEILRAWAVADG
jgi:D-alanyl-D-alanine carboxypeptidase